MRLWIALLFAMPFLLLATASQAKSPFLTPQDVQAPGSLEWRVEQLERKVEKLQKLLLQQGKLPASSLMQQPAPPKVDKKALEEKRRAMRQQILLRKQAAKKRRKAFKKAQKNYAEQQIQVTEIQWRPKSQEQPAAVFFGLHNRGKRALSRVVVEIDLLDLHGNILATERFKPIMSAGVMANRESALQPESHWKRKNGFPVQDTQEPVKQVKGRIFEVQFWDDKL
ncbi:hypothetical protein [Magnetococcus sp. PR-3]|uniref:hypothetical protein n=1 Tax=Magnetococcus sp. PR-3 TaxID=3120355 RepID=UPI002FCDE504